MEELNEEVASNDQSVELDRANNADVIVITGMSGAGKSETMRVFEDLGYFVIDNLPPSLLEPLVNLVGLPAGSDRKLAVVCDMRSREFFQELETELQKLDNHEVSYLTLFLDAHNNTILNRYSALRRRHPLFQEKMSILTVIEHEREELASIRRKADYVVDTTKLSPKQLRSRILEIFSNTDPHLNMSTTIFSFGFKHGAPHDADIVFDVRFLPNPYYDPEMRTMTGHDEKVYDYVIDRPETQSFLECWFQLLDTVMPRYVAEGKQHLTIAIGCTGGQHRSVVIANEIANYLTDKGYRVSVFDRDIELAEKSGK